MHRRRSRRVISISISQRRLCGQNGTKAQRKILKFPDLSFIICALDTGRRRGEIFKLKWSDIDFENRIINILALNTKTMRELQVAMTSRLYEKLNSLWQSSSKNLDDLVLALLLVPRKYLRG